MTTKQTRLDKKRIFCIKFTGPNRTTHNDYVWSENGWNSISKDKIIPCKNGFHGCPITKEAIKHWANNRSEMYICELYDKSGIIKHGSTWYTEKYCARHGRLVQKIELNTILNLKLESLVEYIESIISSLECDRARGRASCVLPK